VTSGYSWAVRKPTLCVEPDHYGSRCEARDLGEGGGEHATCESGGGRAGMKFSVRVDRVG